MSHRAPDQDMVPEPTHEVEEREQDQRRAWLRRRAGQHESAHLATVTAYIALSSWSKQRIVQFQIRPNDTQLVCVLYFHTTEFCARFDDESETIDPVAEITRKV